MHYPINDNEYRSSAYNKRVRFLVLHYTAASFASSLKWLTTKTSAHYLVPDPTEKTYKHKKLEIFNLVNEEDRAWHAGVSGWENRVNLNDQSIGIEIINLASYDQKTGFNFVDYNDDQIEAVIQLCHTIIPKYSDITTTRVIGHSDIAPGRKHDPGPKFPWYKLYQSGIGAWYDESTKEKYVTQYQKSGLPAIRHIQSQLKKYGYPIQITETLDQLTEFCIKALQMHFRPKKYDGQVDIETAAILNALIDKYK